MADADDILAQYGAGYVAPQLASGDGETLDTQGILNQYNAREAGVPGFLRRMADRIRGWAPQPETAPVNNLTGRERNLETRVPHNIPLLAETVGVHMPAGALDTAANWIAGTPRVGPDTIAPLGLAAMAPMTAVTGAAGIFGGRLARTADREALARAEEMAARGASRDDIWNQTGWFQGRDGQWRFEIDDSRARIPDPTVENLLQRGESGGTAMRAGMNHPEFFDAYPDARYLSYLYGVNPQERGGYFASGQQFDTTGRPISRDEGLVQATGRDPQDVRSIALHELQHYAQRAEGHSPGGNPTDARRTISAEYNRLADRINEIITAAGGNLRNASPEARAQVDALRAEMRAVPSDPVEFYRRLAGETEARNVQMRRDFSPEARRAIPPWRSQDVPDTEQILRQYSAGPSMSASLPMDEASRMARAREMGFDTGTTYYHGTDADFDAFRPMNNSGGPRAVYVTPNREFAGMFTHQGLARAPADSPYAPTGERIMPLHLRHEGFADLTSEADLGRVATALSARTAGRLTPEQALEQLRNRIRDGRLDWAYRDAVSAVQDAGFPGVHLNDSYGPSVAVFDPSRIRSPRAAFDPAMRDSANLLAAENARGSLPGVVAQGLEGSARAEADDILRQYTRPETEAQIAEFQREGTLRPEHAVTEAMMPMSSFNGRDIRATQTTVDPRGVRFWERQIREGARPSVLLEETSPGQYRIADGHTRATAYSRLGVEEVPVLVRERTKGGAEADQILQQYTKGPPREHPVSAAVRINGEVFTGPTHWNAVEAAAKKLGISPEEAAAMTHPLLRNAAQANDMEGYVTNTGRYIQDGREAATLAEGAGARLGYPSGAWLESGDLPRISEAVSQPAGRK